MKKDKPKKGSFEELLQKYYNAKGQEKKILLGLIKLKKPDFKE